MSKILAVACLILFLFYLNRTIVLGSGIDQKRKEEDFKYSRLWFGPRIGRRKRTPNDDIFRSLDKNSEDKLLIDFIKKSPMTAVILFSGKDFVVSFLNIIFQTFYIFSFKKKSIIYESLQCYFVFDLVDISKNNSNKIDKTLLSTTKTEPLILGIYR